MREGCVFSAELPIILAPSEPAKKELLAGGTPVYVTSHHRFGADALLLADFCAVHKSWAACDLGSGCGIVPLRWHDLGHRGLCVGVELSGAGAALLARAASELGEAERIHALCCDLREISSKTLQKEQRQLLTAEGFDLVSCNPPYFTGGFVSQKPGRGAARHTLTCTLPDVMTAGRFLLKNGGRLCLCNRPERLADTITAAQTAGLAAKRLRFVKNRPESEPWLFLIELRKGAASGLRVLPDLCTQNEAKDPSGELLALYAKRKENP